MRIIHSVVIAGSLWLGVPARAADAPRARGKELAQLTWVQAKEALGPATVVVLAVGAQAKEHGPHLPLSADFIQAEYFKSRVLAAADVVAAPTLNYSYYPAFVEYPGSTSLQLSVARELLLDVVHSIAKFGPRKFYVINVGVSTNKPLAEAAAILAVEGIALRYLDLVGPAVGAIEAPVRTQKEGSHADEIETSLMLAIAPDRVDMTKAVAEYPGRPGPLSLDPRSATFSRSGIYGDATRASAAKGKLLVEGLTRLMLSDIELLRAAPTPEPLPLMGRLTPRPPAPVPAAK